ncbi:MAG: alcohol dehydrogenase catalytic domain-containing protein [Candidatus Poribacteria bacterium]|nr:alcohol dehydrogenase catalytic domain-containing protein [Candidatus Poribacteria bacterium]
MTQRYQTVLFNEANRPLVLEERDLPPLSEGEARLKIDLCGVCASDLLAIDGGASDYSPPVALGHEIAAVVVESRSTHAHVGDRVSVNPMISCRECRECRRGQDRYCARLYGIGHDIDGGFAEYMTAPKPLVERGGLLRVPEETPPERLMFVEPLGCVLNAVHDAPFGETAAILGAGPIGLLFTQLAAKSGARVFVVEPVKERREKALARGAELALEPTAEGYAELRARTDGGADSVVCATEAEHAVQQALGAAGRGGSVNFFGLAPAGRTLAIDLERLHFQGHSLRASWAFTRRSLEEARQMIVDGEIDLSDLKPRRFSLSKANEAVQYARRQRGVKAALDPSLR